MQVCKVILEWNTPQSDLRSLQATPETVQSCPVFQLDHTSPSPNNTCAVGWVALRLVGDSRLLHQLHVARYNTDGVKLHQEVSACYNFLYVICDNSYPRDQFEVSALALFKILNLLLMSQLLIKL